MQGDSCLSNKGSHLGRPPITGKEGKKIPISTEINHLYPVKKQFLRNPHSPGTLLWCNCNQRSRNWNFNWPIKEFLNSSSMRNLTKPQTPNPKSQFLHLGASMELGLRSSSGFHHFPLPSFNTDGFDLITEQVNRMKKRWIGEEWQKRCMLWG